MRTMLLFSNLLATGRTTNGRATNGRAILVFLLLFLLSGLLSGTAWAQATIRYVKEGGSGLKNGQNWNNASDNLQVMIDDVANAGGGEVWVAVGTYKPGTSRNASFQMKNKVKIYGGFAGGENTLADRPAMNPVANQPSSSTISGDVGEVGVSNDNSYHLFYHPDGTNLNSTAVLDGFVLTGGYGDENWMFSPNNSQGGAIFNQGSSPTIKNCSFLKNFSAFGGAIFQKAGHPAVINCSFQENRALEDGGGICFYQTNATVINCTFLKNSADVGGAVSNSANRSLDGSYVTILNSSFQDNFLNPGYAFGSAIFGYNEESTCETTVINSVFWNNGGNNTIYYSCGTFGPWPTINVRNSLLESSVGRYTDGGNNLISTTSPFVSATSFELAAGSQAINAGSDDDYIAANGPATDVAGLPRVRQGHIDMGAVEFQGPCATPVVTAVKVPLEPIAITVPLSLTINYAETSITSATITWGDGTAPETVSNPAAPQAHTYAKPGVYSLTVTIGNDCGNTSVPFTPQQYAVVYDPTAGFVTGGGWITSPVVNTTACASCTFMQTSGRASFGFVAKYQKGAKVPTGDTDFKFEAGSLSFTSTAYEWLVIAGSKAQFKGVGTINGTGSYGFLLTGTDGDLNKVKGPDLFRIKIWDKNQNDAVVYDNQYGASDTADPTTAIGGGSIVIRDPNGKNARGAYGLEPVLSADALLLRNYPNPVAEQTTLEFMLPQGGAYRLEVVDLGGKPVVQWPAGQAAAGQVYQVSWERTQTPGGVYVGRLTTEQGSKAIRLMLK